MAAHSHHWRIETPNGPTSEGACHCGAVRAFANYLAGEGFSERGFTLKSRGQDDYGRGDVRGFEAFRGAPARW